MSAQHAAKGEKAKNEYDVIIVGSGAAGSSSAAFLADKGYKVLMLDKATFPRDKTCGDGISGKSASQLVKLGLIKEIESRPSAPMTGVIFSSPDGTMLDVPIPKGGTIDKGYCCRRFVFDEMVFENAKSKKGVKVIEGFTFTDLIKEGNQVAGVKGVNAGTKKEEEYRAKVVVGADGAHSLVAKKINAHDLDPKHTIVGIRSYYAGVTGMTDRIELHFTPELNPGYFWIFPLEEGKANVGLGLLMSDQQQKKLNMNDKLFEIINNNPLFKERFRDAKLIDGTLKGWTLPVGSKLRKMHDNGVLLVGDAAALIDPITGEGIGNALVSGEFAADAIDNAFKAGDFSAKTLGAYAERVKNQLGSEMQISYRLQTAARWPWLMNFLFHKAHKNEELRHYISMSMVKQEAKQEFYDPLFYLKLLFK